MTCSPLSFIVELLRDDFFTILVDCEGSEARAPERLSVIDQGWQQRFWEVSPKPGHGNLQPPGKSMWYDHLQLVQTIFLWLVCQ